MATNIYISRELITYEELNFEQLNERVYNYDDIVDQEEDNNIGTWVGRILGILGLVPKVGTTASIAGIIMSFFPQSNSIEDPEVLKEIFLDIEKEVKRKDDATGKKHKAKIDYVYKTSTERRSFYDLPKATIALDRVDYEIVESPTCYTIEAKNSGGFVYTAIDTDRDNADVKVWVKYYKEEDFNGDEKILVASKTEEAEGDIENIFDHVDSDKWNIAKAKFYVNHRLYKEMLVCNYDEHQLLD